MSVIYINSYQFAAAPPSGYDPDAAAYIARVEGASGDNQALETAVKDAINAFVVGCKADGIWNAIKASCILAGARTLNGALQPLVGAAPTPFGFAEADYVRKTGLIGNRTTKYINSNRANNADPQNSKHSSAFITSYPNIAGSLIASNESLTSGSTDLLHGNNLVSRINGTASITYFGLETYGFIGASRASSSTISAIKGGTVTSFSQTSSAPTTANLYIFSGPLRGSLSGHRIAFYSIGESLDLALLDARVTALINAFGAAIP